MLSAIVLFMTTKMATQVCSQIVRLDGKFAAGKSFLRRPNEIRYLQYAYTGSMQGECPDPLILLCREFCE